MSDKLRPYSGLGWVALFLFLFGHLFGWWLFAFLFAGGYYAVCFHLLSAPSLTLYRKQADKWVKSKEWTCGVNEQVMVCASNLLNQSFHIVGYYSDGKRVQAKKAGDSSACLMTFSTTGEHTASSYNWCPLPFPFTFYVSRIKERTIQVV